MSEIVSDRPRRREVDSIFGQIKTMWPLIMACAVGYTGFELLRYRVGVNEVKSENAIERVSIIERKIDVHGQMLSDIRDAVKDIARSQRRGRDE